MKPRALLWLFVAVLAVATQGAISAPPAQRPRRTSPTIIDYPGPWIIGHDDFVIGVLREQDPQDPLAPSLTPEFRAVMDAANRRRATGKDDAGPRTNAESCRPPGMPDLMRYPVAIELLFTPGRATLISEEGPAVRRIYIDGRSHDPTAEPTYLGESIGHWEGRTLVVDTTAISPKAQLIGAVHTSGYAHIVERVHLKDRTHLQIDTVVEDSLALEKPWRYTRIYQALSSAFVEAVCLDNNRDADGGEPDLTPPAATVTP
jgi:hypothetical protein